MGRKVFVIGVGLTKFEKPFSRDWDYPDMAREAGLMALRDAGRDLREHRAGLRGIRVRRFHARAARGL